MHVQTLQLEATGLDGVQRAHQLAVPDAVLAVLTAGVGLVGVAVAKAGVDAQPHRVPRAGSAQLVEHVDRAAVHRHTHFGHTRQRGTVQDVSGEHDVGMAVCAQARRKTGRQRTLDLAQRH
jgi:hypothetical protein